MFAALAHRVLVLPSTALPGGQHPPDDDAVTGFPWDSSESAATATGAVTTAPANAIASTAPPHTLTRRPGVIVDSIHRMNSRLHPSLSHNDEVHELMSHSPTQPNIGPGSAPRYRTSVP